MSTKASLQYVALGSYPTGTKCSWHVYIECLDDSTRLTIEWFNRDIVEARVLGPVARWIVTHGPIRLWRNRQARRWWKANEREIQWRMKLKGLR